MMETSWTGRLTPTDLRALTPLFYLHVNPYGKFELDMGVRLSLDAAAGAHQRAQPDQATAFPLETVRSGFAHPVML